VDEIAAELGVKRSSANVCRKNVRRQARELGVWAKAADATNHGHSVLRCHRCQYCTTSTKPARWRISHVFGG